MDIIPRDEAIDLFDLSRIGKSPARFDSDKLHGVNAYFIKIMDDDALYELIAASIAQLGNVPTSSAAESRIIKLLPLLKERAKTHLDIAGTIGYLLGDGAVDIDDDATKLLTDDAKAILHDLDISLASAVWDPDGLRAAINAYLAKKGLKMRDIGLPLRAAVTGTKQTPSIIDIMVALGKSETSVRLQVACK